MPTATYIDLLRHGQPIGGNKYRGDIDDPLSDKGWAQMRHATSGETPWTRIISSPLCRCSDFAKELATQLVLPLHIEQDLSEIGFGAWQGKSGAELKVTDPDCLTRFYHDPIHQQPKGAEPIHQFHQRTGQIYDNYSKKYPNEHLLIIAHAGVIRAIICRAIQLPEQYMFRLHVDPAHLSRIKIYAERPDTLIFHGREVL